MEICQKEKGSVFIVEDDEDLLGYYCFLLGMNEWEILGVTKNGYQAIEIFQDFNKKPDLVILDLELPGCSGIEVAKKILEHSPKQSIFFISGNIHLLNKYSLFKNNLKLLTPFSSSQFFIKLDSVLSTEEKSC